MSRWRGRSADDGRALDGGGSGASWVASTPPSGLGVDGSATYVASSSYGLGGAGGTGVANRITVSGVAGSNGYAALTYLG